MIWVVGGAAAVLAFLAGFRAGRARQWAELDAEFWRGVRAAQRARAGEIVHRGGGAS